MELLPCVALPVLPTLELSMKTSIFDMNFVLPPVAVMTQVEKDMPSAGTFTASVGSIMNPMCY